ncbi:ankyrin repeat-containing domain protein, partial [Mycena polygramma]
LQIAASQGNLEMTKLLLEQGADPDIEGGEYGTALVAATVSGHPEIVKLLLQSGADASIQGGRHGTALQAATNQGSAEIIELLGEIMGGKRREGWVH